MPATVNGRRVAIVDGLRTPFAKAGTDLADASTLDLSTAVVTELLARSGLDPELVDRVVFGAVVQDVHAPNIAREIVLATPFPTRSTPTASPGPAPPAPKPRSTPPKRSSSATSTSPSSAERIRCPILRSRSRPGSWT